MKITLENTSANIVRSWSPGQIRVGETVLHGNVILTAERIIAPWQVGEAATLDENDFAPILALSPEIIVLGTGERIVFPDAALTGAILARGVGLEVMDTAAACRTFNVLVHEQRQVAAALLL